MQRFDNERRGGRTISHFDLLPNRACVHNGSCHSLSVCMGEGVIRRNEYICETNDRTL